MPQGLQYTIGTGINAANFASFGRNSFQPAVDLGELLHNTKMYGLAARMNDGNILEDRDGTHDRGQISTIEAHVEKYLTGEGKEFVKYLKKKGMKPQLDGIGSAPLGDRTVAAVAKNEYVTLLLGNRNFNSHVQQLGREYSLNDEEALEYVLTHEMGHTAGVEKEVDNEKLLHEYFQARANDYRTKFQEAERKGDKEGMSAAAGPLRRYHKLAKVAEYRAKQGENALRGNTPYTGS